VAKEPEELSVIVSDRDSVNALLYPASKKDRVGVTVILGHGAGANQLSPFMRLFASGLAARGLDAMTFNFVYMDQGRRVPDPKAKLEACYRAVIKVATQHKKLKGNRLAIGGKSMGGRIASQVAAQVWTGLTGSSAEGGHQSKKLTSKAASSNEIPHADLAGLVLLGYPLHPPGKTEQLRDAHLKDIHVPMLFVQGSRDAFGTPDELRAVIRRLRLPATLHVIEGGDHSFKVPKSSSLTQEQIYESAMDQIARFVGT
jgi:predicted alpha/beta-hydrolase family hydrolase